MPTEFVANVSAYSDLGDFMGYFQLRIPVSSPGSYVVTGNEQMPQNPRAGDGEAAYCSSTRPTVFSRSDVLRTAMLPYPPLESEDSELLVPDTPHFGMVTCVFALGVNDILVAGAVAFGRIKDGVVQWRVEFTGVTNFICTCIAVKGGNAMFIYSDFFQSKARAFPSAISRSDGTQDPAAVTIYDTVPPPEDEDPIKLDGAHLLPHVMPDFDTAVDHSAVFFGEYIDDPIAILTGPAVDNGGGSMTVAGASGGQDSEGGQGFGNMTRTSVLSGTTFSAADRVFSEQLTETAWRAMLPALPPGFDYYTTQWTSVFVSFAPPPGPTEFWTHLFHAAETI